MARLLVLSLVLIHHNGEILIDARQGWLPSCEADGMSEHTDAIEEGFSFFVDRL
jgi:hypothetical protein